MIPEGAGSGGLGRFGADADEDCSCRTLPVVFPFLELDRARTDCRRPRCHRRGYSRRCPRCGSPYGVEGPRGRIRAAHVGAEAIADDLLTRYFPGRGRPRRRQTRTFASGTPFPEKMFRCERAVPPITLFAHTGVPVRSVLDVHEPPVSKRRETDDVVVDGVARAGIARNSVPRVPGDDVASRERGLADRVVIRPRAELDSDPVEIEGGPREAERPARDPFPRSCRRRDCPSHFPPRARQTCVGYRRRCL